MKEEVIFKEEGESSDPFWIVCSCHQDWIRSISLGPFTLKVTAEEQLAKVIEHNSKIEDGWESIHLANVWYNPTSRGNEKDEPNYLFHDPEY